MTIYNIHHPSSFLFSIIIIFTPHHYHHHHHHHPNHNNKNHLHHHQHHPNNNADIYKNGINTGEQKNSSIFICDLAGVEDRFPSNNKNHLHHHQHHHVPSHHTHSSPYSLPYRRWEIIGIYNDDMLQRTYDISCNERNGTIIE